MPIQTKCNTQKDKAEALNPAPIDENATIKTQKGCGLPSSFQAEIKLKSAITALDGSTASGTDAVLINNLKTILSEILAELT